MPSETPSRRAREYFVVYRWACEAPTIEQADRIARNEGLGDYIILRRRKP